MCVLCLREAGGAWNTWLGTSADWLRTCVLHVHALVQPWQRMRTVCASVPLACCAGVRAFIPRSRARTAVAANAYSMYIRAPCLLRWGACIYPTVTRSDGCGSECVQYVHPCPLPVALGCVHSSHGHALRRLWQRMRTVCTSVPLTCCAGVRAFIPRSRARTAVAVNVYGMHIHAPYLMRWGVCIYPTVTRLHCHSGACIRYAHSCPLPVALVCVA